MKRRKQICFVADDQDGCGEYAVTVCGLSILNARITRDKEQVSCSLCKIQIEIEARQFPEDTMPDEQTDDMGFPFPKYESDRDETPDDDRELIPFMLENL